MKTRVVTLTINEPEPGDTLPFIVLGTEYNWVLRYDECGTLLGPDGCAISGEFATVLGIGAAIEVTRVWRVA